MSRKIIEKESKHWVAKNIITSEQQRLILAQYTERDRTIGLIPILGSILFGIGILSFIAANWQGMPLMFRLALILIFLICFYISGEYHLRKKNDKLGIAFISMGLMTFGAGILLVEHMLQRQPFDVSSFIVWGAVAVALTYLYRSRYIYILSVLIIYITQQYNLLEFDRFSYINFTLLVIGLGYYLWKRQDPILAWLFSLCFIAQSLMMVLINDWKFMWAFVPIFILYTFVDALPNNQRERLYPLQTVPLIASYIFIVIVVLFTGELVSLKADVLPTTIPFFLSIIPIFTISLALKWRHERGISMLDWMVLPVFMFLPLKVDLLYLIVLFLYPLYVLWRGYIEQWAAKINLGTILFLISTMIAYGKLTWGMIDRSLFFIIGGIVLLVLGWFLNRRRNAFFKQEHGGHDHD